MSKLPTASALERAASCPGGLRLPVYREDTVHSTWGTVAHAYLANVVAAGRDTALERVPEEHRAACAVIDLDALPSLDPEGCAAEVAYGYAFEMDIGRELGRGMSREESYARLEADELGGTADLVAITDDAAVIVDWKTGHGAITPAARNWQMRALALFACRTYERDRAVVQLVNPITGWRDTAEFDALDLEQIRDEIIGVVAAVRAPTPPLARGPWCTHCASFDACPAQWDLIRAAANPNGVMHLAEVALDNGAAAEAYRVWKELNLLTKKLGARLGAVASVRPIDLGNGMRYGLARGDERVADPAVVRRVLTEVLSLEAAATAVKEETALEATKASITAAMKGLKKAQREQVWEALRAAGALKANETIKEFAVDDGGEEAA